MLSSGGDFAKLLSVAKKGFERGLEGAKAVGEAVGAVVAEEAPIILHGASKVLRDYRLGSPVATCGPGDIWAIYSATSKKPGALQKDVSVWVLDKKRLQEANKQVGRPHSFDALFSQQKKSCQHMMRLKHPGVVKVVEQLDDTAQQMVLVTEPILGSLRNVLTHFSSVPGASQESTEMAFSSLELKQGLVHVTDTLAWLHNDAKLVHCGLAPAVIMLTGEGVWKLAGFSFSVAAGQQPEPYYYSDTFPPLWDELAKPALPYAAPELVGGAGGLQSTSGSTVTASTDVFSLATVLYELLSSGNQLLPVRNNVNEYRAKLGALGARSGLSGGAQDALNGMPASLQGVMHSMLSMMPASRPSVGALTASGYFQDDVLLRALRFLDTILQREHTQKLAFFKDLSQFWTQFDDRMLQLRVLPPLIQELRSEAMQPVLLPLVLQMLERVTPVHFNSVLLPALVPILESAQGDLLGVLLGGSATLAKLMTGAAVGRYLIPLYARALDSESSPQVQETCLRMLQGAVQSLDFSLLKQQIMPRCYTVCMHTTAASVRVHAFALMTKSVPRLDKDEAIKMIDTAAQVVSVDRSAPTIMCVVALSEAVSAQHGMEVTAARLLPLLTHLLLCPSLALNEFGKLYSTVQGMMERIHAHVSGERRAAAAAATSQGHQQAKSAATDTATASWNAPIEPMSYKHRTSTSTSISSNQAQPAAKGTWGSQQSTPAGPAGGAAAAATPWVSSPASTAPQPATGSTASAGWGMPNSTSPASGGSGLSNWTGAGAMNSVSMSNGHTTSPSMRPQAASRAQEPGDLFGGLAVHDTGSSTSNTGIGGSLQPHNSPISALDMLPGGSAGGMSLNLASSPSWNNTQSSHHSMQSPGPSMKSMLATGGSLTGSVGLGGGLGIGVGSSMTANRVASSGDPFSSLTAIAMSAPPVPYQQQKVSNGPSRMSMPSLPPPPKASSSVQAQQPASSSIDLLW